MPLNGGGGDRRGKRGGGGGDSHYSLNLIELMYNIELTRLTDLSPPSFCGAWGGGVQEIAMHISSEALF